MVKNMGKTYIDTVKYLVYADLEIDGLVEKPDVVGAVFGQTEGLLGGELDLRELQKNGRIGRIEVDMNPRGGKTIGKIRLPSSLDMVETCILAAALEAVDRVGPCEANIRVEKVEDTRSVKRKALVDRAKGLLKNLLVHEIPESREISDMVRDEVKTAEITEYGPEKLPCGPGIEKTEQVIIVEGRADVVTLLKNDMPNVVAVGGAKVPETIAKLCREKEVTVFLDGDRGGDIILNELANVIEIDFVARAPAGKEVEELSRKELIKCIRAKIPFEQAIANRNGGDNREERRYGGSGQGRFNERRDYRGGRPQERAQPYREQRQEPERQQEQPAPPMPVQQFVQEAPVVHEQPAAKPAYEAPAHVAAPVRAPAHHPAHPAVEVPRALVTSLNELENTLRARFYDGEAKMIKEIPVRDMIKALESEEGVNAVVFDGIITQRLADLAENKKVPYLLGVKLGNVFRHPAGVTIHTKA
jgi:DNA primase